MSVRSTEKSVNLNDFIPVFALRTVLLKLTNRFVKIENPKFDRKSVNLQIFQMNFCQLHLEIVVLKLTKKI